MANEPFGRPMSNKRAYYEFGKFLSERAASGTVDDALQELEKKLEGTSLMAPKKSQASKLRKTYELYVRDFGFSIDRLEKISAFDLYRACTGKDKREGKGEDKIVHTKADAEALINRLNSGENFTRICKEYGQAPKTAPEYVVEKILAYISGVNNQGSLDEVQTLTIKYKAFIKAERGNSARADKLFLDYNKAIIDLIVRANSKPHQR